MTPPFHYQRPFFNSSLINYLVYVVVLYILLIAFKTFENAIDLPIAVIVIMIISGLIRTSAFRITGDRIEFLHPITRKIKGSLRTDQILQVRFEDGFQSATSFVQYILIYPVDPALAPGKARDRIRLYVSRTEDISTLLSYFDRQGCDVKVLTNDRKLIRETGLENWNEVPRTA